MYACIWLRILSPWLSPAGKRRIRDNRQHSKWMPLRQFQYGRLSKDAELVHPSLTCGFYIHAYNISRIIDFHTFPYLANALKTLRLHSPRVMHYKIRHLFSTTWYYLNTSRVTRYTEYFRVLVPNSFRFIKNFWVGIARKLFWISQVASTHDRAALRLCVPSTLARTHDTPTLEHGLYKGVFKACRARIYYIRLHTLSSPSSHIDRNVGGRTYADLLQQIKATERNKPFGASECERYRQMRAF